MPSLYVAINSMTVAMNNNNDLTRRSFLASASALGASAFARLAGPSITAIAQAAYSAKAQAAEFRALSRAEAADIAAIAARIIPTTDTPGASEAGVVYFFDNALAGEMKDRMAEIRNGLAELNSAAGESAHFADLSADEQDAQLRAIEASAFFGLIREMTIFGFFAMSKHGGNRDHIAWDLIGFEGHHGAWEYPFGHYDAEAHGDSGDGE
jgi:gluconate 2-dehydrogenase gamma chain